MENFTIADNISATTVEDLTTAFVNNITTTFVSILATQMELNITDNTTTEQFAQALTSSLTSTESSATTPTEILTTDTSMEDIESTTAAAKYIGCKPSYFCLSFESCKSRPRSDHGNPGFTRHENILQRPEYNRPLQYAVYSRPTTANINQMSNADARGYGFSGFDDEEPQVKVFTRGGGEDHIIDPPPQYDSLVPPSYSAGQNTYSSAASPAYYTYETSRNVGDVRL
ncbi:unnamed protein product [Allacma fusca]|uniref:Uncharacterized protein n=1 Tax=Allacma fusca TaxID=39272 RepID=A0A8J2KPF3_9HEXA|nr:unnamed protein product [Allacma fusca]